VAWARTNDLGEYRFGQPAGGTYYLVVSGEPWYTARSQPLRAPGQQVESTLSEPARSYAPVYFPNANDADGARPIELGPGADVSADFRLSTITGVNLHVHCPHPAGQSPLIALLTDGAAGRRRVQMTGADGFFAAQITAEGVAINGPVIEIVPGATIQLSIVATDETGTLKGFVMNGDKPVPGVLAVLAPKNDSKDPGDYRGFQTDSDGSYDYQNVRAGEYVLFAVERLDLEYANPAAVRPYLASGKPVRIPAYATIVENASLIWRGTRRWFINFP
jgi:hypothetical protein